MSTVDKMLIKGIRSFDPENRNVITFFRPLTLIVGPNGAGKTTIIECLKLSCTGELPPNARSGHSFIHDPKVAGETETKGQIKLRFKTAAGKDVVCIRSFQLTQKASKMEYKAIESVLQTLNPHTGEKVCLSYRCADMDWEIPALMGVSKAILENVIFVHQDEANWPLQDSSTLKKKFDDIFSATRYTKALEVIKKLHKDQSVEIKTYKLKLEHLQTLKDAAYKLRESVSQDQEKTEVLKNQMQELEKNMKTVDSDTDNIKATLKELQEIKGQISIKTVERKTLVREQEEKYQKLSEESEDTDAELNEWKTKFDERIMLLDNKISKRERGKTDLEEMISSFRRKRESNIWQISKLQRDAENLAVEKADRDSIIRRLYANYNLGHLQGAPFTDEAAMELVNRTEHRSEELDRNLEDKKMSNDRHLERAWSSYTIADERWKNAEAQKQAKLEIKKNLLKRLEEKKSERESLELLLSDINLSQIDEKERNMQVELERKKNQLDERNFKSSIEAKEEHIRQIDHKIQVLNRERDLMNKDANTRMTLSIRKSELENQKKKHKKIIDDHKDKIRLVLKGRLPSEKDLKKDIAQALRALQKELTEPTSKSREAEMEVNVLQAKVQEVNDNLSKHRKDLDSRKLLIESRLQCLEQQTFAVDSYPKIFETAKEKRDVQKSKYNIADGMRKMFDPFEKVARAHHICPCCERPFSAEEEDNFVRKQRVKAANSAEHVKVLAVESSNAESILQQLDKLRIVYDEYVKLGKEVIPLEENKLQELSEKLDQKSQDLEDVIGIVAQIEAEKQAVENLVGPVDAAAGLFQEIQALQKEIDDLEYSLPLRGLDIRTIEDVQLELNNLQETKDDLYREVSSLREQQSSMQQELSSLEMRWRNIREEKIELANNLQNAKRLDEELEGLVEEESRTDLEIQHLAEAISLLLRETQKFLSDYKNLKDKLDREYEEEVEHRGKYQQEVETLRRTTSKIEEYLDKGQKLKEFQEQQSDIESQLQNYETRLQELITELQKNKDVRSNQDLLRRNIEDNLSYRKTKLEVEECTREIESLEEKMLKIGRIERFEIEAEKLSQEKERLLSELNRCQGTFSVYQSNILENKRALKQAQYKDIDKRYYDQLIQLKTTEMANKDLDRYYNALDKALMRFHTMKMEEINKIIRELWQQTYRGQDIDYICIHSDSEGAGTRSYSYKVLMQTGDAELEMRGRCSAGQKVLASLIIRLALAETFCLSCGILALDEPTTNLDGPNTESLAAALLKIMEDRKGQENFQLIVITHDERFAQLIGQRQHAERYYRVSKDDHQHSIIEAQEIFD